MTACGEITVGSKKYDFERHSTFLEDLWPAFKKINTVTLKKKEASLPIFNGHLNLNPGDRKSIGPMFTQSEYLAGSKIPKFKLSFVIYCKDLSKQQKVQSQVEIQELNHSYGVEEGSGIMNKGGESKVLTRWKSQSHKIRWGGGVEVFITESSTTSLSGRWYSGLFIKNIGQIPLEILTVTMNFEKLKERNILR